MGGGGGRGGHGVWKKKSEDSWLVMRIFFLFVFSFVVLYHLMLDKLVCMGFFGVRSP